MQRMIGAVSLALIVVAVPAFAASDEDKCEAGKNKIAGKYYACRENAEAKAILKATTPDYSKCTAQFTEKWNMAETKGEGMCPDDVLTADMQSLLESQASTVAEIVAGTAVSPSCGDGIVNTVGEHCDGADLDGNSCATLGHVQGTLSCTAGCEFDVAQCSMCTGLVYADACWFLGSSGDTCDETCLAAGEVYDDATNSVAGFSGTAADCEALLDQLGAPGTGLDHPFELFLFNGSGCCVQGSTRIRNVGMPTTSDVNFAGEQRVCACQ